MTTRVTVHRINMERYKSLLMGDLTPYGGDIRIQRRHSSGLTSDAQLAQLVVIRKTLFAPLRGGVI